MIKRNCLEKWMMNLLYSTCYVHRLIHPPNYWTYNKLHINWNSKFLFRISSILQLRKILFCLHTFMIFNFCGHISYNSSFLLFKIFWFGINLLILLFFISFPFFLHISSTCIYANFSSNLFCCWLNIMVNLDRAWNSNVSLKQILL